MSFSFSIDSRRLASLVLAGLLVGCGGGGTGPSASPDSGGAVRPQALSTTIPVTRAQCTPFGNPPAPRNDLLSTVQLAATICTGGTRLPDWLDGNGTPRGACLYDPGTATPDKPLPLVLFLHGSAVPPDVQLPTTNVLQSLSTADLSGDPARPGFVMIEVLGRVTDHHYPAPNNTNTIGYDVWYRQFLPTARSVNGELYPPHADAAAVDHYLAEHLASGTVDRNRIYMLGWSNGAALSLLYAQNRPNIAAVAMYSGPDPYDSLSDPCGQVPVIGAPLDDRELQVLHPGVPVFHIQNNCDTNGSCPNGLAMRDKLLGSGTADITHQMIDGVPTQAATSECDASCGTDPRGDGNNLVAKIVGQLNHSAWPRPWTAAYFEFLREHPLSARPR